MKSYKKITYIIIVCFVIISALVFSYSNINNLLSYGTEKSKDEDMVKKYTQCKNRLHSLEPDEAKNIDSWPIYGTSLPSNVLPVSEVLKRGKEIPLKFAYNDLNWQRPAYKSYWHTTPNGGRWSYVPIRINYALHRIFATYPTASIYYDFVHDLGINEESRNFDFDYTDINQIVLVAMQSNIKKIITLGNQVIIIVEPMRSGLQVVAIPENIIQPSEKEEATIFQMITPDGYEIDYCLLNLKD